MYVFMEKYERFSLNYPRYPIYTLSGKKCLGNLYEITHFVLQVLPDNEKRLTKDLANQALKDKLGTATKTPTEQGAAGGTEEMEDGMNQDL